jgi:hypothetical protein
MRDLNNHFADQRDHDTTLKLTYALEESPPHVCSGGFFLYALLIGVNLPFAARIGVPSREGDYGASAPLVELYASTLHYDPASDSLG